jgi:hypothetical protein
MVEQWKVGRWEAGMTWYQGQNAKFWKGLPLESKNALACNAGHNILFTHRAYGWVMNKLEGEQHEWYRSQNAKFDIHTFTDYSWGTSRGAFLTLEMHWWMDLHWLVEYPNLNEHIISDDTHLWRLVESGDGGVEPIPTNNSTNRQFTPALVKGFKSVSWVWIWINKGDNEFTYLRRLVESGDGEVEPIPMNNSTNRQFTPAFVKGFKSVSWVYESESTS